MLSIQRYLIISAFLMLTVVHIDTANADEASEMEASRLRHAQMDAYTYKNYGSASEYNEFNEWRLKISAVGEKVFEREFKDDEATELELDSGMVKIGMTNEELEIYGLVGIMQLEFKEDADNIASTDPDLIYGVGAKYTYDLGDEWNVSLLAQYRRSEPEFDKFTALGVNLISFVDDMVYQDWKAAATISKALGPFEPFVGLEYSDFQISDIRLVGGTTLDDTAHADEKVGPVVGVKMKINDQAAVIVEGRFLHEKSIQVEGEYKF